MSRLRSYPGTLSGRPSLCFGTLRIPAASDSDLGPVPPDTPSLQRETKKSIERNTTLSYVWYCIQFINIDLAIIFSLRYREVNLKKIQYR